MLMLRLSSWLTVTGSVLGRLVSCCLLSTAPSSLAVPATGDGNRPGEDSTKGSQFSGTISVRTSVFIKDQCGSPLLQVKSV